LAEKNAETTSIVSDEDRSLEYTFLKLFHRHIKNMSILWSRFA